MAEALAREGFDTVILDLQHGALDFVGASRAILAVAIAGRPAIVRPPVGDFASASRLLDAGAAGVIAPMINSRADAERFASFAKFPPLGERSWGPGAALPLSGLDSHRYLASANGLVQAIAMIETREALEALDDILDVAGIDGVFIGPADLSIALSNGARWEPRGPAVIEAAPASSPAPARTASTPACSVTTAPTPARWPSSASDCARWVGLAFLRAAATSRTRGGPTPIGDQLWKGSRNRTRYHELDGSGGCPCMADRRTLLSCIGRREPLE